MTNQSILAPMNERVWDIVILGATGDAGMAIATYVAGNCDTYTKAGSKPFRWAIAGRSVDKLERLRSRIMAGCDKPSTNDEIGILRSDVGVARDMSELAKSTRVLLSAVGPYTVLGERVFLACVEQGTNYVDITGEVDWVGSMREKYKEQAGISGSTLCSFAGFDCVPCDMTMYLARKALSECDGKNAIITGLETVSYAPNGVFPRGTIRTMLAKLPEGSTFVGKLVRYAGSEGGVHWKTALALARWLLPKWSPEYGAFTLPHFMGWCNIPVIYKSHDSSLDCTFHDRLAVPNSKGCLGTGYGLLQTVLVYLVLLVIAPYFLLLQIVIFFAPSTAKLLLRYFDSLQYRGNSNSRQKQMDNSAIDIWSYTKSSSGSKATVHLHVEGDAGIKATALLAGETTFSMLELLDKNKLPKGLIGSPSEIVGDTLLERLRDEETIGRSCTLTVMVVEKGSAEKKED